MKTGAVWIWYKNNNTMVFYGFLHLSHLQRPLWHMALLEHQPLYFLFLHLFRTRGTFLFLQYWWEGQWWSSSHSTHRNPSHLPVKRIQIMNKQNKKSNRLFKKSNLLRLFWHGIWCRLSPSSFRYKEVK